MDNYHNTKLNKGQENPRKFSLFSFGVNGSQIIIDADPIIMFSREKALASK